MKKSQLALSLLSGSGATRLLDAYWGPQRLTVLAYHRIADANAPDFLYYRSNVSATPEMFERQMAWCAKHFNVIDLTLLLAFLQKGRPLPPRPMLITFDDGYLDNYTQALPILQRYGLPAVIFLMTDRMDYPAPPWWDEVAYLFDQTRKTGATLPLIGQHDLSTPELRVQTREKLMRQLKLVPETRKQEALQELRDVLEVAPPGAEPPLFVSWDQVRELVSYGISCQPHTISHPILTRIDEAEVRRQVTESKARIEAETLRPAQFFAYPNGTLADYSPFAMRALREAGYLAAVTLTPGPMRMRAVQRHPYQIARVYVGFWDSFEMFVMKVMGLPALLKQQKFLQEQAVD